MASWDVYSFSNDRVMDLLQVSGSNRILMISSKDTAHDSLTLQEIISKFYSFTLDDPQALMDEILSKELFENDTVGIAVLFAGNNIFYSEGLISTSIKILAHWLLDEEYLKTWGKYKEMRKRSIIEEICLLAKFLAEYNQVSIKNICDM